MRFDKSILHLPWYKLYLSYLQRTTAKKVVAEGLHLRHSLGQWTSDSNLEWQSPTNVIFDMTLHSQAIPIRSSRHSTIFSAWRHAPVSPPSLLRLQSAPCIHLRLRLAARRFRFHHQPPHLSRSRLTCCFNPLVPGSCCRNSNNMSPTHV